jgi:predicted nucleic acid-binding protein
VQVKLFKNGQSQAVSLNLPLATNNTSEFERVPNLTLENWAE